MVKKLLLLGSILFIIVLVSGCTQKSVVEDTKNMNTQKETEQPAAPAIEVAKEFNLADGQYAVNVTASKMFWHGEKIVGAAHDGTIAIKSGAFEVADGEVKSGEFVIDMSTVTEDKDNSRVVTHLLSEDFFNISEYPESKLEFISVKPLAGDRYEIEGSLTIKDVSKPVIFIADVTEMDSGFKGMADITIDRTEWGVKYGSGKFFKEIGDAAIRDNIEFKVELAATRE